MEYPLYIGTRKTNMPNNIYIGEYTCKVFQEPNAIQFGRKHQVNQEESTPKCDAKRLSKLYQNPNQHMIEERSNQHMIDSKTHQHMKCDINGNRIKTTHDR